MNLPSKIILEMDIRRICFASAERLESGALSSIACILLFEFSYSALSLHYEKGLVCK